MHASDLVQHLRDHPRNRRLMARVMLNLLGHARSYPVDISELRTLSSYNRALLNAFMQWYVSNRKFRYGEVFLPHLTGMAGRPSHLRPWRAGR